MGTRHRGTAREIRALNACIKLVRATESIRSGLERKLLKYGLTISQFGILEALFHLGPLSQRDLGRKLLRSGGNITTVVDNLEKRKLVRRERDGRDRRLVTVHLTAEGRRLARKVLPGHVAAVVTAMDVLAAAEQDHLGRLCKKAGLANSR